MITSKLFSRFLVILLIFALSAAYSREEGSAERPRIGLVLSGGGARGFAHIGVLKILDSLNVPIDYIAGTSIGAVVGGLYAIGYSAEQIDLLARGVDWPQIFTDTPVRKKLSYFEKREMGRFQLSFKLENFKLEAPSALIYGQKVSLLLSGLTLLLNEQTNFDSLDTPFRCVAADLITGNEVVLKKGSLAKAIRASLSVPSVFSPVEWGDSLLVDGGVLNNCPVDVVREMGAEYVIAVNVGTPKKPRRELDNALAILLQSFNLAGYQREEENLRDADIVVTPDLKNFSNTDFTSSRVDQMIRRGKLAGTKHIGKFVKLAPDIREQIHHEHKGLDESAKIYGIRIAGNKRLPFSFIYQLLGLKPGTILNTDVIEQRIEHLYGLGYFRTVTYRLENHSPDFYIVHIDVEEKPQRFVRIGMRYEDDKKVIAGVNLRFFDFPFGGIRNDLSYLFAGLQLLEWEISFPRRMFGSQVYPYMVGYFQDIPLNIYSNHDKVAVYHRRSLGSVAGLGLIVRNWGTIKAEYVLEKLMIKPSVASYEGTVWPEWRYNLHTGRIYAEMDLLDDPLVPQHGYKGQLGYEATLDIIRQRDQYRRIYFKSDFYGTIFSRMTTRVHFFVGLTDRAPIYRYFYLGGPDTFVGMNYDESAGPNLGYYRIENRFRLNRAVSILGIFNAGNHWENYREIDLNVNKITGYGAGIQVKTVLGPMRYIVGRSEGQTHWYFTLGFSLAMHNDERL